MNIYLQYHLGCHLECHFECHLECHYIISLYLTLNLTLFHLNLTLPHLNLSLYLTLQVTPLLTKIKSHEIIIFHKKNIIRYFCLFNPKTFLIFAQKVQYNTLLDMKIQEVMKLQRKALGITQQDLADMSEIAISTIKKIESGKGNPSLSTVEKIMDILGMEVKYEIRQTV